MTEKEQQGNIVIAEFDGKLATCLQCGGSGMVVGFRTAATCCGSPLSTGGCCNYPVPEQVAEPEPCIVCEATGYSVDISDLDYHTNLNSLYEVWQKTVEVINNNEEAYLPFLNNKITLSGSSISATGNDLIKDIMLSFAEAKPKSEIFEAVVVFIKEFNKWREQNNS